MKVENIQSCKSHPKDSDDGRYRISIGNAIFYVNVHFGKIPLEDILSRRILADNTKKLIK